MLGYSTVSRVRKTKLDGLEKMHLVGAGRKNKHRALTKTILLLTQEIPKPEARRVVRRSNIHA